MEGMLNLNENNFLKEDNLLDERENLVLLKKDKIDEMREIDNKIITIENEIQAYKIYKKNLIKKAVINILQITGVVLLFALPFNFLKLSFFSISSKTLKIINLLSLCFGIFGNSIILTLLGCDISDYKKDKQNLNRKEISNLENVKNDLEDYIEELNKELVKNEKELNEIYNSFMNTKVELKYANEYDKENNVIKKKEFKK